MSRLRVVTDSTVWLADPQFAAKHNTVILPLTIHLGTRSYLDGSEISAGDLQPAAGTPSVLPVVASPSVDTYTSVLESLTHCSSDILCLHVSGKLCRTVRNARAASETLMGRTNIAVIDSLTTSAGLGLLVEEATRLADDGASLDDVVRHIRYLILRLYAVVLVEDLAYLQRAGHLSRSQVLLGEMMGIKPFLSLEDGSFVPLEKVRTREQAIEKLIEFVGEFTHLRQLAVLQGSDHLQSDVELLIERVREIFPTCPIVIARLSASVASLLGPRALGLVAYDMPAA